MALPTRLAKAVATVDGDEAILALTDGRHERCPHQLGAASIVMVRLAGCGRSTSPQDCARSPGRVRRAANRGNPPQNGVRTMRFRLMVYEPDDFRAGFPRSRCDGLRSLTDRLRPAAPLRTMVRRWRSQRSHGNTGVKHPFHSKVSL